MRINFKYVLGGFAAAWFLMCASDALAQTACTSPENIERAKALEEVTYIEAGDTLIFTFHKQGAENMVTVWNYDKHLDLWCLTEPEGG